MTSNMTSFIMHFLNDEPFNLNLSTLQFDSMQPQQLLQLLSNVLCWIFDQERIDIKREAAEETAIRVLNSLRILRYRPPQDQEEQEEWRAGIVEGRKGSLYPLLVFLFENSEALKERAYLAKYLMKTDVPGEFFDYDIEELQNDVTELMNEFKEIHAETKDIMADVLLLNDIKEDLKSMEKEKLILIRKIERTEAKVQTIPYFEKQMQLASQLRGEKSRYAELMQQKQIERQKVLNIESRINRMKINLSEAQAVADTLDEQALMEKLEDEVATNTFLANGKLFNEIEYKENKLRELINMANSNSVTEEDLQKMTEDIEEMRKRIRKLEDERDHKEVDIDENMSVVRHQVSTLERKKEIAVQKLQELRQDLARIEKDVEDRKNDLKDKMGGDVVSNVQYRKYLEQYRAKSEEQKRKRLEEELTYAEKGVLSGTVDILSKRFKELESHIESLGGEVVEVLNVPTKYDRPKTAAPQTNDAEDIKFEMQDMMRALDERKERITDQRQVRDEMRNALIKMTEELEERQKQQAEIMSEIQLKHRMKVDKIKALEDSIANCKEDIPRLAKELQGLLEDKNSLDGVAGSNLEDLVAEATGKENEIDAAVGEIGDVDEQRYQAEMWKDVLSMFELKMDFIAGKLDAPSYPY
ncbi:Protein CBR-IFT-81 [Caenorhabditis briggsae]|uniref:Intraflagellar transport protein 81 homolog n=2 Tax=Caenorhabditis briggsae TaxID=6238 RepID=A0AAE9CUQ5_CAEBR|nr:Protein CBR-IFT-81 [Caenorhabditis briggsae]ULT82391.1 hypothetical protein L3Y34_011979 [Caenorhabditis briggsae]CAP33113.2 Protein CBR-IFT-81 [Caenorhabditis briggsae]